MAKFVFWLDSGFVGAERRKVVEIDIEELSPEEVEELINDTFMEWVANYAGWYPIEEE